jgi:ribonucleoside-diphosphate reductase alpha chain
MEKFLKERLETGRYYVMNIDHCNEHGSFQERVTMTNLCCEITHPTQPIKDVNDDEAEIGVCVLSALNLGQIETDEEMAIACDIVVRLLDEVIDNQEYPVKAAERFTKKRRSLGVGVSNLAYFLAKNNLKYGDPEAWNLVDEKIEAMQYYLLKSSNRLAVSKGPCDKFHLTKYAQGILPIDTYKKAVDKVVTRKPTKDWEQLRRDILEHGLRHSTVTAAMPVESSSVTQNSTNGIEPPRSLLAVKKSKTGALRLLAPDCYTIGHQYTLAYEMENNRGYINIVAAIQKWFDMAISANLYYDYTNGKYSDKKIPLSELANDVLYAYQMGVKTLYYSNTNDGNGEDEADGGCSGGACKL